MYTFRIKLDDNVKDMLPNTLLDMKRSLYEVDFVSIMNESDVDGLCNV